MNPSSAPPSPASPVPNKGMITLSVMLATIMQVLDTTIANVALPHMQGSLSATQDQVSWVLTSYIIASAIMTPPTGWMAGRFGRKKVFLIAVAGFTFFSVLCGAATSINEIVLYRIMQGAFGAALVPLSQSTMLDINPREKHGAAMAMWGVGIMLGPILGPALGGYLTEYYNWRWVFYINLPVGIISFLGISAFLPDTGRSERPFDTFGFITLSLAIGCMQLLLDRGGQKDWFESYEIILYALGIAAALWMFIFHSSVARHPFLCIDILVDRNFMTSVVFIFFVGVILLASMALMPPFMQNLMGYQVVDIGVLIAPRGIGTMVAMVIVGKVSGKLDPRIMIAFGLIVTALSLWQMSQFTTFVPQSMIINTGLVQGFGLGFIFVPLNTIAFATLAPEHRTEAAGLFSLMRNLGSSIGISVVIAVLEHNIQVNHAYLAEHITSFNTGLAASYMAQLMPGAQVMAIMGLIDMEVNRQAATIAYINDFVLMMWVVLSALPLIFFLKNPHRKKKGNEEGEPPMME